MTAPLNQKLSKMRTDDNAEWLRTVTKAVKESDGNVSAVCRKLGVNMSTMMRWIAEEPQLKDAVKRARIETIREQ